jgi:hypothetical protein
MPYLVAAIVLVGAVCVLDLVLTLGVIRRLRHHSELLSGGAGSAQRAAEPVMLAAGEKPADFVTATIDGQAISRDTLTAGTVAGFFTAHCMPCKERVPEFMDHVSALPSGRDQALAVVVGDDADTDELAESLAGIARVVREKHGDPVATAFGVRGYPALCVLDDDGTIRASGFKLEEIRIGIPA